MTERPGQQPPQKPRRSKAPEGKREVLEGRVIPSREQQQRQYQAQPPPANPPNDPHRRYDADLSTGQAPAGGPAWSSQQAPKASPHFAAAPQQGPPQGPREGPPRARTRQPPAGPAGREAQGRRDRQGTPRPGQARQQPPRPRRTAAPPPTRPGHGADSGFRSGSGGLTGPGATPDWDALADGYAAETARRRRRRMLIGGIVALAVIVGGVAAAVLASGKDSGGPAASASPTGSAAGAGTSGRSGAPQASPSPSAATTPSPANPLDYLSTAAKDTAPISPATLFPASQFLVSGHTYTRSGTAATTNCASGAREALSTALTANGCRQLFRVTYLTGPVAVTVGIAVFDDSAHAAKLQKAAEYVAPLPGVGVGDFCHAVACRMTSNAIGRYAYFAIAGLKNGKTIDAKDAVALRAANDASNFAFQRIIQRAKDAASAG